MNRRTFLRAIAVLGSAVAFMPQELFSVPEEEFAELTAEELRIIHDGFWSVYKDAFTQSFYGSSALLDRLNKKVGPVTGQYFIIGGPSK